MIPFEIITETCHANLDSLIGTEVLDRVVTSETVLCVLFKPPSLVVKSSVEYLRREFEKIESHFSGKSLKIMRCLLDTEEGKAHRKKLMKDVWGETVPMFGTIRRAVHRLNANLAKQNFGYTVEGNLKGSKGIYRLAPIEK